MLQAAIGATTSILSKDDDDCSDVDGNSITTQQSFKVRICGW